MNGVSSNVFWRGAARRRRQESSSCAKSETVETRKRTRMSAYLRMSVDLRLTESPIQSPDHESRDLERERNPRPPRAIPSVGGRGTARSDLPAGDQGEAWSDPAKLFD